ncbi:hypothetical protein [Phaeovulum sp. NW3]|uniref:hypothetical protein n=1 Tax=Phaeovulum sp. NW3 TaxID=2934933 RepID=UPI002020033D|nr:hypothetical protein [Phaeovulum sp. NW3]MCL7466496.1 hypothetical protein [Phaeovulum sp. NW3]
MQLIFALDAIFPQPNLPGVGGFATQIRIPLKMLCFLILLESRGIHLTKVNSPSPLRRCHLLILPLQRLCTPLLWAGATVGASFLPGPDRSGQRHLRTGRARLQGPEDPVTGAESGAVNRRSRRWPD